MLLTSAFPCTLLFLYIHVSCKYVCWHNFICYCLGYLSWQNPGSALKYNMSSFTMCLWWHSLQHCLFPVFHFDSLRLTFALTDVGTFLKLFCISLLLFYSRFVGVWSSFGSLPQPYWILFSGSLFWILAWEPCNYYFWSICSWAISLRIKGEYVFKVLKEDKINCMVWSGSHVLVLVVVWVGHGAYGRNCWL